MSSQFLSLFTNFIHSGKHLIYFFFLYHVWKMLYKVNSKCTIVWEFICKFCIIYSANKMNRCSAFFLTNVIGMKSKKFNPWHDLNLWPIYTFPRHRSIIPLHPFIASPLYLKKIYYINKKHYKVVLLYNIKTRTILYRTTSKLL